MTTTPAVELLDTHGTKPKGPAKGTERWLTVTADDGTLTVTAYTGWNITDEVRLAGATATAGNLLDRVVEGLMSHVRGGACYLYDAVTRSFVTIPE